MQRSQGNAIEESHQNAQHSRADVNATITLVPKKTETDKDGIDETKQM